MNLATWRSSTLAYPAEDDVRTNQECFKQARRFFDYASVEGFRGSPHKL